MSRIAAIALAAVSTLAVAPLSYAQGADSQRTPGTSMPAPDNSASNKPERAGAQPTADEQSNSKSDVDVTQRIRRSVMDDKGLSVYAQNVKIVSANGKVTLNGVVRSADEKKSIGMKAAAVVGNDKVMNELKIAPAN